MSLTLLAMGVAGGLSALNQYKKGKAQQGAEDDQRKFYQGEISKANEFKKELIGEQKSSGTDMFTNYITTRDNQKASGIANMYLQRYSDFKNSIKNTDMQLGALRGEMANVGRTSNADIYGDVLTDVAGTTANMYGVRQSELANARSLHNQEQMLGMINDPTKQYEKFKPTTLGEEFGNMWQSFKNGFSDSDSTSKFGNAPTTMPEIKEMPNEFTRSRYISDKLNSDMAGHRISNSAFKSLSNRYITNGNMKESPFSKDMFNKPKKISWNVTNSAWDNYFN